MRLKTGKRHHYEFDARVPFLICGPGIIPSSHPAWLTGNVDFAPTILELAGWRSAASPRVWEPPSQMDGTSFARKLMGSAAVVPPPAVPARAERSEFILEFTGLTKWPKGEGPDGACPASGCHSLNDCPNNTYRALRIVTPSNESWSSGLGSNLLYTEFTTTSDWFYKNVFFRSLFDLDADPYQLKNVLPSVPTAAATKLAQRMAQVWGCVGKACP